MQPAGCKELENHLLSDWHIIMRYALAHEDRTVREIEKIQVEAAFLLWKLIFSFYLCKVGLYLHVLDAFLPALLKYCFIM